MVWLKCYDHLHLPGWVPERGTRALVSYTALGYSTADRIYTVRLYKPYTTVSKAVGLCKCHLAR